MPGSQDHTDSEHQSLLPWDDGVREILTNGERSCAAEAHATYHKHGNIHGMTPEQMGPVWQGVWAEPNMPGREEISYSSATNVGDAGRALRQLDIITGQASVGSGNTELSAEHHTPVASHVADNKRSKVLQIITRSTAHNDIIPDGSLMLSDIYNEQMPKGCAPMTKMLMQLLVTTGRHPFVGMTGLDMSIRKDLVDLMRKFTIYTGADAPDDELLQNLTLQEVCEINVTRWLVLNTKGEGEQKWDYINAHLITLNVPYYVEHNRVQWLDGFMFGPVPCGPIDFR